MSIAAVAIALAACTACGSAPEFWPRQMSSARPCGRHLPWPKLLWQDVDQRVLTLRGGGRGLNGRGLDESALAAHGDPLMLLLAEGSQVQRQQGADTGSFPSDTSVRVRLRASVTGGKTSPREMFEPTIEDLLLTVRGNRKRKYQSKEFRHQARGELAAARSASGMQERGGTRAYGKNLPHAHGHGGAPEADDNGGRENAMELAERPDCVSSASIGMKPAAPSQVRRKHAPEFDAASEGLGARERRSRARARAREELSEHSDEEGGARGSAEAHSAPGSHEDVETEGETGGQTPRDAKRDAKRKKEERERKREEAIQLLDPAKEEEKRLLQVQQETVRAVQGVKRLHRQNLKLVQRSLVPMSQDKLKKMPKCVDGQVCPVSVGQCRIWKRPGPNVVVKKPRHTRFDGVFEDENAPAAAA